MKKVIDLGHTHIRHGLVDDLFDLDRSHTDDERSAEHDAVLAQSLAGDHRRQLYHQADAWFQVAMLQHLVEREVVKDLDKLRIGHGQL